MGYKNKCGDPLPIFPLKAPPHTHTHTTQLTVASLQLVHLMTLAWLAVPTWIIERHTRHWTNMVCPAVLVLEPELELSPYGGGASSLYGAAQRHNNG